MKKNTKLRRAITQALGLVASGGLSGQAAAIDLPNLGAVDASSPIITTSSAAPIRAWSDYGTNRNYGWTHTAHFYTFQVGSLTDISNGSRFDIDIRVQGIGDTPLSAPGFSIWTSGTNPTVAPFSSSSGYGHDWSQVRGPYDGGFGGKPCTIYCGLGSNGWMATWGPGAGQSSNPGNILIGHDGWVGFANAGYSFENGDYDLIPGLFAGATNPNNESKYWNVDSQQYDALTNVNANSPWVNGGDVSLAVGDASLNLLGLKSGYYMIAVAGSCPDDNLNGQSCGDGGTGSYQLSISNASAVPVPGAVWLFGSALAGWIGIRRRQQLAG